VPYEIVDRRSGDVDTVYADPGLALRELSWKANKGLKEMCKWQIILQHLVSVFISSCTVSLLLLLLFSG